MRSQRFAPVVVLVVLAALIAASGCSGSPGGSQPPPVTATIPTTTRTVVYTTVPPPATTAPVPAVTDTPAPQVTPTWTPGTIYQATSNLRITGPVTGSLAPGTLTIDQIRFTAEKAPRVEDIAKENILITMTKSGKTTGLNYNVVERRNDSGDEVLSEGEAWTFVVYFPPAWVIYPGEAFDLHVQSPGSDTVVRSRAPTSPSAVMVLA